RAYIRTRTTTPMLCRCSHTAACSWCASCSHGGHVRRRAGLSPARLAAHPPRGSVIISDTQRPGAGGAGAGMRGDGSGVTVAERLGHGLASALAALPPGVQVRLSGKPPVRIDGETLSPEMQLMLALLERRGQRPSQTLTPADARRERRRLAAVFAGKPAAIGSVRELEIDAAVPLRTRHYAPSEPGGPHPLLVFFHGGGFMYGDLDTHDGVRR